MTTLIVVWNGHILSVLVLPVNLKASGFALTLVENALSNCSHLEAVVCDMHLYNKI